MMPSTPERIRQDGRLIGQTIFKLGLPRLVFQLAGLAVAAVIWLLVTNWLRDFGHTIRLDSLQALGPQAIDFLNRAFPYAWWGVIAIWTLIVFFTARGWLTGSLAAGRARVLSPDVLADLRPQLSEEAVDVLRWVWNARREPFTMGDLQRANRELRSNRAGKIAMVREQAAVLDQTTGDNHDRDSRREPAPRSPVEPTLGRAR